MFSRMARGSLPGFAASRHHLAAVEKTLARYGDWDTGGYRGFPLCFRRWMSAHGFGRVFLQDIGGWAFSTRVPLKPRIATGATMAKGAMPARGRTHSFGTTVLTNFTVVAEG